MTNILVTSLFSLSPPDDRWMSISQVTRMGDGGRLMLEDTRCLSDPGAGNCFDGNPMEVSELIVTNT